MAGNQLSVTSLVIVLLYNLNLDFFFYLIAFAVIIAQALYKE